MKFTRATIGKICAVALLTVGLAACQEPGDDAAISPPDDGTEAVTPEMMAAVEGTLWTLVSYNQVPVIAESEVTLELIDGRLSGSTGCNQYFADYQLIDAQLIVDTAGVTKRACEPQLMEQERAYLRLLQQTDSAIATSENILTIETPEGDLVFEAASPAS